MSRKVSVAQVATAQEAPERGLPARVQEAGDLPRGCLPEDDAPVFRAPPPTPQTPTKPVWQNRSAAASFASLLSAWRTVAASL